MVFCAPRADEFGAGQLPDLGGAPDVPAPWPRCWWPWSSGRIESWRARAFPPRWGPRGAAALLLGVSLAAGAVTIQRNRDYRTAEALYAATVRDRPDNPYAHADYGLALGQEGRTDAAIAELTAALRLKPDFADAHYNLGLGADAGRARVGGHRGVRKRRARAAGLSPRRFTALGPRWPRAGGAGRRSHPCLAPGRRAGSPIFGAAHSALGQALVAEDRIMEGVAELDRSLELRGDSRRRPQRPWARCWPQRGSGISALRGIRGCRASGPGLRRNPARAAAPPAGAQIARAQPGQHRDFIGPAHGPRAAMRPEPWRSRASGGVSPHIGRSPRNSSRLPPARGRG